MAGFVGVSYGSESITSSNVTYHFSIDSEPKIDLGTIIASIIALVGSVFTGTFLAQRYRKRNLYSDPYIKWCIGAFGTIHEFKELYDNIQKEYPPGKVISFTPNNSNGVTNPIFIISHLWEMHREVEKGYQWLGQIEKLDKCSALAFNTLFDDVDYLWHFLEEKEKSLLASQMNPDNFRKILHKLHGTNANNVAKEIILRIRASDFAKIDKKEKALSKCDIDIEKPVFPIVIDFLFRKIPKPWYLPNRHRE